MTDKIMSARDKIRYWMPWGKPGQMVEIFEFDPNCFVSYYQHSNKLEAQAKLYEGQIESMQKILLSVQNRIDNHDDLSCSCFQSAPCGKCVNLGEASMSIEQSLANLAEFRKKVG